MPLPLTANWNLLTRPTLPIIWGSLPSGQNSAGNYTFSTELGLGNMQLPLMLSPNSKAKFTWGLGPVFSFPTNTDDRFGADTWDMGFASLGVYKPNKDWLLGGQLSYWWSVEEDDDAEDQSYGQLIYFIFKALGGGRQIGSTGTIKYDNNAESGNKWNIPIGLMYSYMTHLGDVPMKIQLGFEASIVKEDDYGKACMFKINFIPVIPGFVQKPLFD